jgi:hypothetical protein
LGSGAELLELVRDGEPPLVILDDTSHEVWDKIVPGIRELVRVLLLVMWWLNGRGKGSPWDPPPPPPRMFPGDDDRAHHRRAVCFVEQPIEPGIVPYRVVEVWLSESGAGVVRKTYRGENTTERAFAMPTEDCARFFGRLAELGVERFRSSAGVTGDLDHLAVQTLRYFDGARIHEMSYFTAGEQGMSSTDDRTTDERAAFELVAAMYRARSSD